MSSTKALNDVDKIILPGTLATSTVILSSDDASKSLSLPIVLYLIAFPALLVVISLPASRVSGVSPSVVNDICPPTPNTA